MRFSNCLIVLILLTVGFLEVNAQNDKKMTKKDLRNILTPMQFYVTQ